MVLAASDWRWSSARAHLGIGDGDWLDMTRWKERYDTASWARALEVGIRDSALEERIAAGKIWHQTKLVARPCGKAVGKLFADAEGGEDAVQDVVGGGFAGDGVQRVERAVEIQEEHFVGNMLLYRQLRAA